MAYADTTELARVLKIRNVSSEVEAALDRVLEAATWKIDKELDLAAGSSLDAGALATAEHVCLGYACDLWRFQEVQQGLVGLGTEFGPSYVPRDLWKKWAIELESAKEQFGFA